MDASNMSNGDVFARDHAWQENPILSSISELDSEELVELSEQYARAGSYEESKICLLRALYRDIKSHGVAHPRITFLMDSLYWFYISQNKQSELSKLEHWKRLIKEKLALEAQSTEAQTLPHINAAEEHAQAAGVEPETFTARSAETENNGMKTGKPADVDLVTIEHQTAEADTAKSDATEAEKLEAKLSTTAFEIVYTPPKFLSQLQRSATPVARQPATELIVDRSGQRVHLGTGTIWIGRDRMNDICIEGDADVGRSQAAISCEENDHWICNQDQAKIMRLNGNQLEGKSKLCTGDVIEIGHTKIRVS